MPSEADRLLKGRGTHTTYFSPLFPPSHSLLSIIAFRRLFPASIKSLRADVNRNKMGRASQLSIEMGSLEEMAGV